MIHAFKIVKTINEIATAWGCEGEGGGVSVWGEGVRWGWGRNKDVCTTTGGWEWGWEHSIGGHHPRSQGSVQGAYVFSSGWLGVLWSLLSSSEYFRKWMNIVESNTHYWKEPPWVWLVSWLSKVCWVHRVPWVPWVPWFRWVPCVSWASWVLWSL